MEHIKILKDGFENHHVKKNAMKFKDKSDALAMLDTDSASLVAIVLMKCLITILMLIRTMQMESSRSQHSMKYRNQLILMNFVMLSTD